MNLKDSVVFITGANRGLGLAFAKAALAAGARKVYGAARDPRTITLPGVVPVPLDVTQPAQIEAAVLACGDVSVLVNNAGISRGSNLLGRRWPGPPSRAWRPTAPPSRRPGR
jgi:NAD(P)-dependent dehydrogenase (short-subunit alcohol dehydrogenase family)